VRSYHVTDIKAGDNERIQALVEQGKATLPEGRSPGGRGAAPWLDWSRRVANLAGYLVAWRMKKAG
jgi:hypothetical protein